jgi:hypothetical protein
MMKKWSLTAIALFVMAASALTLRNGGMQSPATKPELATNAAYRDGLYLGRLATTQGSQPHVSSGRWSSKEDRASFVAGYQDSYDEVLASRVRETNEGKR